MANMNIVYLMSADINAYDFLEKILKEKFNILMPEIKKGAHGKPYFKGSNIYFNISHTEALQAVAIGKSEVGVDIEKIRDVNLQVASRFSNEEYDYVMEAESSNRFFEIWTKKEAYLKYLGTGISGGLKSFSVLDLPIKIMTFKKDDYIISICSESDFKIEVV